jgi:hypothetical protein
MRSDRTWRRTSGRSFIATGDVERSGLATVRAIAIRVNPRPHMKLRREGFAVERHRIYRFNCALELKLRIKRRRYGARAPRGRLPASTAFNERWSRFVRAKGAELKQDKTSTPLILLDPRAEAKRLV